MSKSAAIIEVQKSVLAHIDVLTQWTFLLNGAAAAGVLTFLGNSLERKALFAHWPSLSGAILWFSVGLLLAVFTRVATLIALNFFSQTSEPTASTSVEELRIYLLVGDRAVIFSFVAVAFFIASCGCFLGGVLSGRYAVFG
jgi:hypothetical protein